MVQDEKQKWKIMGRKMNRASEVTDNIEEKPNVY